MGKTIIPGSNTTSITKIYDMGNQIGTGKFSVVKLATEKSTGKKVAIKIMKKSVVEQQSIIKEVEIMSEVKHQNVIGLKEVFETESEILLVLELVTGGELFDKIVEREAYTEEDASQLVNTVTKVIQYLHSKDIVHCDLKPENLLYSDHSDNAVIKLCDFGLSQKCPQGNQLRSLVGTLTYMAPEISNCTGYGKPVDMWSLGVIIYILLCGFPPFDESTGYYLEFPSPEWDNISDSAKNLIKSLLVTDPSKRLTAEQTLKHHWVSGSNVGKQSIIGTLKTLKEFNTIRRSGTTTMGHNKQSRGTVFELFPSLTPVKESQSPIQVSPSTSFQDQQEESMPKSPFILSNNNNNIDTNQINNIESNNNSCNITPKTPIIIPTESTIPFELPNDCTLKIIPNENDLISGIIKSERKELNSSFSEILKKQLITSLDLEIDSSSETCSSSPMEIPDKLNSPELSSLSIDLGCASDQDFMKQKVIEQLRREKEQLLKEIETLRQQQQQPQTQQPLFRSPSPAAGRPINDSNQSTASSNGGSYYEHLFGSSPLLRGHSRNSSTGGSGDEKSKDKSKYGVDRIVGDLQSEFDKLSLPKETHDKINHILINYRVKNQEKSLKLKLEKQKDKYKKLKAQLKKDGKLVK
ncbi:hypothetical protein CYY_008578 [Polysphondylium violaceum]|uniref:non-specific serine/threonine protein kinase n=1 Tax=Polysphondylium violaceum TaxID=133409 RepID=A0A8J4PMS5_9MYCE|nr:hypothetical protein CYY_008578 [Polysphondylium violaceum]